MGVGKCRTRRGKCRAGRAAHILAILDGAARRRSRRGSAHISVALIAEGVGRRVGVGPAFMSKRSAAHGT